MTEVWEWAIVTNEPCLTRNNCSKRATKGQTNATICWIQTVRIMEILFCKTIIRPTIHCKFLQTIRESQDIICPFCEEHTTMRKTSLISGSHVGRVLMWSCGAELCLP